MQEPVPERKRWIGFGVLSLGTLMIVLDTTIVNVALRTVKDDLGFSDAGLAWVVNAYMLTFGGFLLLSGRMGDYFGRRKLLLGGLTVFTLASLACGAAPDPKTLITARAVQGLGGAVVSAVSLSMIMDLFQDPAGRAKAMGFFGFVAAGGGVLGLPLGGALTALDWRWVFLVNVPIGIAVFIATLFVLPVVPGMKSGERLDFGGAVTVTAALVLAVYGFVNTSVAGWRSAETLGLIGTSVFLLVLFLVIERFVKAPIMPLGLFRLRRVATANVVGVLWAAAMFGWFFFAALYMQRVLGYSAFETGMGFLISNVIMAIFSVGLSAKLVMRFGIQKPLVAGLMLAAFGLLLFARAPLEGRYFLDVFPGMVLLGFGAGMAFNPVLLAAMSDVKPQDAGLASGVVNTSFMMGGALGLAILASLAAVRTQAIGGSEASALLGGYHLVFLVGAGCAALAATVGLVMLRGAEAPAGPPDPHAAPTGALVQEPVPEIVE